MVRVKNKSFGLESLMFSFLSGLLSKSEVQEWQNPTFYEGFQVINNAYTVVFPQLPLSLLCTQGQENKEELLYEDGNIDVM